MILRWMGINIVVSFNKKKKILEKRQKIMSLSHKIIPLWETNREWNIINSYGSVIPKGYGSGGLLRDCRE